MRFSFRLIRAGLVMAMGIGISGCAQNLFYQPDRILYDVPTHLGLNFDEVSFSSRDGTQLTGWFIPAAGLADPKQARGTVIHFHGNGQNMSAHWRFAEWLPKHGYNLFVFDYRGYGTSKGSPSVKGVFEDSLAAIDYVRQRPDIDPTRLVIFGQSLGGANAIAAVGSGDKAGVRAVLIESTFLSYSSIASDKVPGSGILMNDDYSPDRWVAAISPIPLILIHGTADQVIPYQQGEALFALAKEPKTFITVPHGLHTQAFTPKFHGAYQQQVLQLLDQILPR
ncbi:MAG: alpha/beta hydrolase [Burkholderiales bacterium]|nr:alpha/beta hydrolase [Burkholderiales bacterium]